MRSAGIPNISGASAHGQMTAITQVAEIRWRHAWVGRHLAPGTWHLTPWLLLVVSCALTAAERPEPRMSFLDNGVVKIGADLALGGAITWLSHCDRPQNLINSHDLGRQIQMSHYSGPVPFRPPGATLHQAWEGIGWNPIQTGDVYGHASRVLEHRNDGRELYVKCVPMHWPLDNVPGECVFESWTTLDGATVRMRFRATNARPDRTWYPARMQELPAVYLISRLHRLMAYAGDRPFTGGEVSHLANDWRKPWPWTRRIATEGWTALVGDDGWGVGVAGENVFQYDGGLYGEAGSDDVRGSPTAYVAPVRIDSFDHDIVYTYATTLTLGTLAEIRARLIAQVRRDPPAWRFATGRDHWYVEGGVDAGRPQDGLWTIPVEHGTPHLVGPIRCWRAEDGPAVVIEAAWTGSAAPGRLRWRRLEDDGFSDERSVAVTFMPDGEMRPVTVALAGDPAYQGLIIGLRLDPPPGGPQARLQVRSVVVQHPR